MDVVRKQSYELMEMAALSSSKEDKMRKISSLIELALFRADAGLLDEIVGSVSQFVSDRAAPVRKCALDFLEKVCCSDKGTDEVAQMALQTASVLTTDDTPSVALKAFKVATRLVNDRSKDCLSSSKDDYGLEDVRDRFAAPLVTAAPAAGDDDDDDDHAAVLGAAAVECILALLLRDADADAAARLKRGSALTKKSAERIAQATKQPRVAAAALAAAGVALARAFPLTHRELVTAVVNALDDAQADAPKKAAALKAAKAALYAAEAARARAAQGGAGAGAISGWNEAAGASRLEAALRRAGEGEAATAALQSARAGAETRLEAARREEEASASSSSTKVAAKKKRPREGEDHNDNTKTGAEPAAKKAATAEEDFGSKMRALANGRVVEAVAKVAEVPAGSRASVSAAHAVLARLARYDLAMARAIPDQALDLAVETYADGGLDLALRILFDAFVAVADAAKKTATTTPLKGGDDDDDDDKEATTAAYDATLLRLVEKLKPALEDSRDRQLFTDTFVAAPRLPRAAVDFLVRCCDAEDAKASSVALGLLTLRDLSIARPSVRAACLEAVLSLTAREDVSAAVRDKAVRLASNQLSTYVALKPAVEAFADDRLRRALTRERGTTPEDDEDDDPAEAAARRLEGLARRDLALVVALCVKEPERRLAPLLRAAAQVPDNGLRAAVFAELQRLAPALATAHGAERTLEMAAAMFLHPRKNGDDGVMVLVPLDDLAVVALRLVTILGPAESKAVRPGVYDGVVKLRDAALVAAAQEEGGAATKDGEADMEDSDAAAAAAATKVAAEANPRVDFFVPVLAAATMEQLTAVLPLMLTHLNDEQLGVALKQAAAPATRRLSAGAPGAASRLTAAEILVALHELGDAVPTKRATEALGVCLALRDAFGATPLKDALDKMTAPRPKNGGGNDDALPPQLPQLLLRTAILAVKMYPSQLSGFVAGTVLDRLATHLAVWTNAALWKGFMMCCTMLADEDGPNCFAAALKLPQTQLVHLLKVAPKLKPALKRHVLSDQLRAANANEPNPFPDATCKLLGVEPTTPGSLAPS